MKKQFSKAAMLFTVALVCMASITACSGTRLAYESADTLEKRAYVVTEHFHALQIEANDLADAGASQSVINKMAAAEVAARPIILGLEPLVDANNAFRSADTEEALSAAITNAVLAIANLVDAVRQR